MRRRPVRRTARGALFSVKNGRKDKGNSETRNREGRRGGRLENKMSTVRLEQIARGAAEIPLQPASYDIWDKKYRLKSKQGEPVDTTIDHTYQRVAKALSDVEATPEKQKYWYERFLWALRRGAIPAGRITSNAGAQEHKPKTSTINCTVSGTIDDSMDNILDKVHEAGLTLKAGCGIGYEFSTLRPRGAYVSGAGAYTSGPLSFMDIYDKMCFTVSSAGGRRGAQMGTFDVSHPDVKEFIRAKREDGRLRQFNLSLLITDGFMDAVEMDSDWPLVFPIHVKEKDEIDFGDATKVVWREWPAHRNYVIREDGLVACKIYGHIRARHLWDMIMVSTYDYAEPGFILIDRVNEMNNNWWCENIRATNPVRRAAAAAVRLVPARLGQPDHLRARSVRPEGALRLGRIPRGRARLHAHARQRRRDQRPAARAAARRDHLQAPPRHGLPRPRLHDHDAEDALRRAGRLRVHRRRLARDGARRLGSGALARQGKGPGADHGAEFEVTGDMLRKRPEMVTDGYKAGDKRAGPRAPRQVQPLHAARCRSRRPSSSPIWPTSARASRTIARSRRPARSRSRSRTTPRTASSRRSRIITAAT